MSILLTAIPFWGQPGHSDRGPESVLVKYQIDQNTAPGWVDWSAQFSSTGIGATTTPPTIGNSTVQAYYRRPEDSDLVHMIFKFTIGSTFAAGSGNYFWPLPMTEGSPQIHTGVSAISDTGNAVRVCAAITNSATTLLIFRNDQGNPVGSSGPGTAWATGDWVQADYVFKPA